MDPSMSYDKTLSVDEKTVLEDLRVEVKNSEEKILVVWQPERNEDKIVPKPAKAAKAPGDIDNNEQLYLTGLHLEQYRHATYSPTDYYKEAIRRDPGDIRCNNALGLLLLKKARFSDAEKHFRTAIATLTDRNPNPYNGEPYFNLGLTLRFQYKKQEAYEAFYKAIWNDAWQGAGYFQLAQIDTKNNKFESALELINKSLIRQWHNHKARHLKVAILRSMGSNNQALELVEESLKIDRFNFGLYYEKYLLTGSEKDLDTLIGLLRNNIHNYIEIALDYAWAGLLDKAISFLKLGIEKQEHNVYPMAWYYLGWFYNLSCKSNEAQKYYKKAEAEDQGTGFPNQLESVLALNNCMHLLGNSCNAPYYLGNFYYHNKEYQMAIENWEISVQNNPDFPTVHRNLALAYYNKAGKKQEAGQELEKAFSLDKSDARVLMEMDALYKRMNRSYSERLLVLQSNPELVEFRDDLYLERITLLNLTGYFEEANKLIMNRKFHPWEGGEGKVTGQYMFSLIEMAKNDICAGEFENAIDKLEKAKSFPHNLGEGKLYGAQENDINYWLGYAYKTAGDNNKANGYWQLASEGLSDPSPAMFYNDQQPDKIFYQGLALAKLGKQEEAKERFNNLITYGKKHISDKVKIDYFAVSLPDLIIWDDDLDRRNILHCKYLMGLGYLGSGNLSQAEEIFSMILNEDSYHIGAHLHMQLINSGLL